MGIGAAGLMPLALREALPALAPRVQLQGDGVDAVALTRRPGPVVEDVPEMGTALAADDLGSAHSVARVRPQLHAVVGNRTCETGPATTGMELVVGVKEHGLARGTPVDAGLLGVDVVSAEGRLGACLSQDRVLLGRQPFAPFLFRSCEVGLHNSSLHPWLGSLSAGDAGKAPENALLPRMLGDGSRGGGAPCLHLVVTLPRRASVQA